METFSFLQCICKVDFLQRILVNLDIDDFITETIGRAHSLLVEIERTENSYGGYSASMQEDGRRGRPSYLISKEQLSYLIEQGFKLQDVATMLGVSCRTVTRRMMSNGLSVSGTCTYGNSYIPLFVINHGNESLDTSLFTYHTLREIQE